MQHSEWSPSGFKQIMLCPGSKVLQAGAPRSTSVYSSEGTAAHQLLTWALEQDLRAEDWLGDKIEADGMVFVVDADMARHVQVAIDYVRDVQGDDGILLVDRRVHFGAYLGVPDDTAFGTLDVAVIRGDEVIAIDLKYGMGVEVSAGNDQTIDFGIGDGNPALIARRPWPNPQLALYALGILAEVKDVADISRVRLAITQPRISVKPSEYDLSVEDLEAWAAGPAREAVGAARQALSVRDGHDRMVNGETWRSAFLHPGDDQCRFCKAKATCPALRAEVADTVFIGSAATPEEFEVVNLNMPQPRDEFDDDRWLPACLSKVDMIEDWCKAVRAEVERRLLAGETVPGFKLVSGKQGNRAWSDPAEAEAMLKSFRLKVEEMYDLKLISPTSAEKLVKAGSIGPRQWVKTEALVSRAPGKPHVAPISDPRPPLVISSVANDFTPVEDFS